MTVASRSGIQVSFNKRSETSIPRHFKAASNNTTRDRLSMSLDDLEGRIGTSVHFALAFEEQHVLAASLAVQQDRTGAASPESAAEATTGCDSWTRATKNSGGVT